MAPPNQSLIRLAIVLNTLFGGFLIVASVIGAVVDVWPQWFGIILGENDPLPFPPEILGVLFVFGVVFLITANSMRDLRLTKVFRLRDLLDKRRRITSSWPYFAAKNHRASDDPPTRIRRKAASEDAKDDSGSNNSNDSSETAQSKA